VSDAAETSDLAHCALLRTKGMYLPPNPRADGNTPEGSSTAVFWCLGTMKMVGPDGGYVAPDACVPGRSCYKAPQ
jgi:hypothetical protein